MRLVRYLSTTAAIIVATMQCLVAQAPSWPPGGLAPAESWGSLKLPQGRFIPSSRRWNLVWADQIVPQWVTPAKVAFAARHYIGTQKIFREQAEQFRAIAPNFLIVAYHLAAGLNPEHNSDAPNPKTLSGDDFIGVVTPKGYVSEYVEYLRPWLAREGVDEGSAQFEAMFQHYDSVHPATRVWHQDPYWLMNLDNADWRLYLQDVVVDWMEGNENEGCFFDVAVETNVTLYNPKAGNQPPVNFNWWESPHRPAGYAGEMKDHAAFAAWMNERYASYFRAIYERFHGGSVEYLVLPNVDQMVTTVYDPTWTDGGAAGETIDGAMMEGFGGYRGYDMWLTLERGLRHITGRGKILIAQFGATTPEERLRRTAMYMLIKNENSYINIINSGRVEWYPEYEIDLGDQSAIPSTLDEMRLAGSEWRSLWGRDYEKGMVLCNTGDAAIMYDPPGDEWMQVVTSGGGEISDDGTPLAQSITYLPVDDLVRIAPSQGVILIRSDAAGVEARGRGVQHLDIEPGENASAVTLRFLLPDAGNVAVEIRDLLGSVVALPSDEYKAAGEHLLRADLSALPSGPYLFTIRTTAGVTTKKYLLIR